MCRVTLVYVFDGCSRPVHGTRIRLVEFTVFTLTVEALKQFHSPTAIFNDLAPQKDTIHTMQDYTSSL